MLGDLGLPGAFKTRLSGPRTAPHLPASSSDASGSQVPVHSIASSGDLVGRSNSPWPPPLKEHTRMLTFLIINAMTVP